MLIRSYYKVKLKTLHGALYKTVQAYRKVVDFYIDVCLSEWKYVCQYDGKFRNTFLEKLTIKTKNNPNVSYVFPLNSFPAYMRRAAIAEAIGKVSSYKSNYANWEENPQGKAPSRPIAGRTYPALYTNYCFRFIDTYEAQIKVLLHSGWDWLNIKLRKSDIDYILHHCSHQKRCVPTLRNRGKNWYLEFTFVQDVQLSNNLIYDQTILSVDLGIRNACVCSVMRSDGNIIARKFLSLPKDMAYIHHKFQLIKKIHQHGNYNVHKLWASIDKCNMKITNKTTQFIVDLAKIYSVDVIVFEYLNITDKKSYISRDIKFWRAQSVQNLVTGKAHKLGIRIRRICPIFTSVLA